MDLKKLDDAIAACRRVPYAPRELLELATVLRDGFLELESRLTQHQTSTSSAIATLRDSIVKISALVTPPPVL